MTLDHGCPRCQKFYDRFQLVLDCMANHERVTVLRDRNDTVCSADEITGEEIGAYAASRLRDQVLAEEARLRLLRGASCATGHLISWTPRGTTDGPLPGAYFCERCGDAVIVPDRPERTVPLTFAHEGPEDVREWWRN